jgi:uncharacterized protein YlxP (DUF503 family)
MVVGTLRLNLLFRGAHSLKEKRQVLRSIKDRVRNRFNVSIAEVEYLTKHQRAGLGLAMVSNDAAYVHGAFQKITELVRLTRGAELLDSEVEIL